MKHLPLKPILFFLATMSLIAQTNPVIGGESVGYGTINVNSSPLLTPTVTGGTGPYIWTVVGTTPLPANLQMIATDGRIFGTPQAATTSAGIVIRLQVADSSSPSRTATRDVTLIIRGTFGIGPISSLPNASVGTSYNQCLTAVGGSSEEAGRPVNYVILSGALPNGMSLVRGCGNGNSSALQGSPSLGGSYSFNIQATDSEGRIATRLYTLIVGATPVLIANPSNSLDFFCTIAVNCTTNQTTSITIQSTPNSGVGITTTAVSTLPSWLEFGCCDNTSLTPSKLTITVKPAAFTQPGVSTATLQVAGPSGVSPITITIRMIVTVVNGAVSNPTSLIFNTTPNGTPEPKTVTITNNGGADATFNLTATTTAGGNWIRLNNASVSTPGEFIVQANPFGLAVGTYNGQIIVSTQAGVAVLTIPVTLNILSSNQVVLSTASIDFNFQNGSGITPNPQPVSVTSSGVPFNITATASTLSGGNWLAVNPQFGSTPATILVSLTNNIPGPGSYVGTVTVNAAGVASQFIRVTLNVTGSANLVPSPTSLSFTQQIGGGQLPSQTLNLSSGLSSFSFSATTLTTDGGNWLSLGQTAGTTPANIQVSVNTTGLAVGSYTGRVIITSGDAPNSPVNVPVTLIISQTGNIGASPTSLSFQYQTGGDLPPGQQLLVASQNSTTFTITPTSNGGWLRASQTSGTTPSSVTISISPSGLAAGNYTGSLSIQSQTAGQISIPVTLTITSPTSLAVSPTSLAFSHRLGSTNPSPQILRVSAGGAATRFTATVRISSGNWLSVSPSNATAPAEVSVSVDPSILPIGDYTASVVLTPADGSPTLTVPVAFSVLAAAKPVVRSFTNAASFIISDAVPGMIFTIFGSGIGPDQTSGVQLTNGVVGTTTGNTRVFIDEFPSPMIYAARDQIAGVIPYGISNRSVVQLTVERNGVRSDPFQLRVANTSPGIFTANASGRGNAAALNQDGSVNSSVNQANPGSIVVLYLTGEGAVTPTPGDGTLSTVPLPRPAGPVIVRIGTLPATVEYAGAAPNLVAGLMQINVRIPLGIAGDVPVSVNIGGNSSPSGVTISVKDVR